MRNVFSLTGAHGVGTAGRYRLGYTPEEAPAANGYDQVDLTIPRPNKLQVQTRDGYYTGK